MPLRDLAETRARSQRAPRGAGDHSSPSWLHPCWGTAGKPCTCETFVFFKVTVSRASSFREKKSPISRVGFSLLHDSCDSEMPKGSLTCDLTTSGCGGSSRVTKINSATRETSVEPVDEEVLPFCRSCVVFFYVKKSEFVFSYRRSKRLSSGLL